MSIHPLARQGFTQEQMQSAVESKLREINNATTDLLQRTTDAGAVTTEELRSEITRLAGIGFTITRLLCLDDVQRAYEIINGDADENGTTLGVAV